MKMMEVMMTQTRHNYTREFKLEILAEIERGIPLAQVARAHNLHPTLVSKWKKDFMENPEEAFRGNGNSYKDQARIAELERLVGNLYAEKEILKKNIETLNSRLREEKRKAELRRSSE
jgi:transposase